MWGRARSRCVAAALAVTASAAALSVAACMAGHTTAHSAPHSSADVAAPARPAAREMLRESAADVAPLSLDIDGAVRVTNNAAHSAYHFSGAQLLALPVHTITTSTSWTPRAAFTGPSLADLLKAVGAYGSKVEIHTLDDYRCIVPVADAVRYGIVMAYAMNGKRLEVSDFGPLFLVYPRDQYPAELDGAAINARFAWQITSMTVKR